MPWMTWMTMNHRSDLLTGVIPVSFSGLAWKMSISSEVILTQKSINFRKSPYALTINDLLLQLYFVYWVICQSIGTCYFLVSFFSSLKVYDYYIGSIEWDAIKNYTVVCLEVWTFLFKEIQCQVNCVVIWLLLRVIALMGQIPAQAGLHLGMWNGHDHGLAKY